MERMGRPKERCSFLRVRVALIVIKSACKKTNKIKSTWEKACFALSYNPHSHIQALKRRGEMCSCCAMYSLLYMAHNQTQVRRLEMIETLPSQSRAVFCFFHSLHWCFTDDNAPRVVDAFQFLLSPPPPPQPQTHTQKKKETLKATILNSTKVLPLLRYAVTQAPALTNQASIFLPFFFFKATKSIRTGKGLVKETE